METISYKLYWLLISYAILLFVEKPFAIYHKDYGQWSGVGIDGRKVCSGSSDGLSIDIDPGSLKSQAEYLKRLRQTYEGCRVVENNVEIGFLHWSWTPQDLDFLDTIEEIHGNLVIFYIGMAELHLPNLKIIWGDTLFDMSQTSKRHDGSFGDYCSTADEGFSLLLLHNSNLTVLSVPNLKAIRRGTVGAVDCPNLCYFQLVDWNEIMGSTGKERFCSYYNEQQMNGSIIASTDWSDCAADMFSNISCSSECQYPHCWGPEADQCQIIYRHGCHHECKSGMCMHANDANACCHSECLAGCNGTAESDCEACMNFKMDGKCVESCPKIRRYDILKAQFVNDANGRYSYFKECVKKCPDHMPVMENACVSKCPAGTHQVNNVNKYCKECMSGDQCEGSGCKVDSNVGITSENIDRLKGCTRIADSIYLGPVAFQNKSLLMTKGNSKEPEYVHLIPITEDQLNGLKSIRNVAGHVYIDLHGDTLPHWLKSASFLSQLETIDGINNMLFSKKFALYILNTDFHYLGLKNLKQIRNGDVLITQNPLLCYSGGLPWSEEIVLKPSKSNIEHWRANRNSRICREDRTTCHPQCKAPGCWGPGPDLCYACENFTYYEKCISTCDTERARFVNESDPSVCRNCHEECLSCFGPRDSDCSKCAHVDLDGRCVNECPYGMYSDPSMNSGRGPVCRNCSDGCAHESHPDRQREPVCDGRGSNAGKGGCTRCQNAIKVPTTEGNITEYELRCVKYLDKANHDCASHNFPNYFQTAPRTKEVEQFVVNRICHPCHSACITCKGYGRKIGDDGCKCKDLIDNIHGECVPKCEKGFYHDDGECILCDEECEGCYGATNADCSQCKRKKAYTANEGFIEYKEAKSRYQNGSAEFNCTASCPDGLPYTMEIEDEQICTGKDPHHRHRITQIITGVVLGAVFLVLILVAISAFIYRRKAAFLQMFGKTYEMEPIETKLNPDAKPNLSKLTLMKETELRRAGMLGYGAFGTVYKGVWIPDGQHVKIPVAIKILNETTPEAQTEMLEEAHRMAGLRHALLVRLVGVCLSTPQMMLVTPLMPLGNLLTYVTKHRQRVGSSALLRWSHQIAAGMAYLETNHVVHRDLAARNVLVQTPKHIRIADFGLAKVIDFGEDEYKSTGGKLPVKWLALESIQFNIFTHKTDVWSYGVTIWELLTFGRKPYQEITGGVKPLLDFLERGERLPQPEICTIDVFMILVKCWMVNAESRPSFAELTEQFAKMCKDPPRYLVIHGDKLLRLPSVTPADEKQLLQEMVPDEFLSEIAEEEEEESLHKLSEMDLVAVDEFMPNNSDTGQFLPSPTSPVKPIVPNQATVQQRLANRQASSGSQRYASDPFRRPVGKPGTDEDVTSRLLPQEADTDNYLIPNPKDEPSAPFLYTEVLHEGNETDGGIPCDQKERLYYNEMPAAESAAPLWHGQENSHPSQPIGIDNLEYMFPDRKRSRPSLEGIPAQNADRKPSLPCLLDSGKHMVSPGNDGAMVTTDDMDYLVPNSKVPNPLDTNPSVVSGTDPYSKGNPAVFSKDRQTNLLQPFSVTNKNPTPNSSTIIELPDKLQSDWQAPQQPDYVNGNVNYGRQKAESAV